MGRAGRCRVDASNRTEVEVNWVGEGDGKTTWRDISLIIFAPAAVEAKLEEGREEQRAAAAAAARSALAAAAAAEGTVARAFLTAPLLWKYRLAL